MTLFALCGFCAGAAFAAWIVRTGETGWSHRLNRPLGAVATLLFAGGVAVSIHVPFGIPVAVVPGRRRHGYPECLSTAFGSRRNFNERDYIYAHHSGHAPGQRIAVFQTEGAKLENPQLPVSCWCSYLLGALVGGITSQIGLWVPLGLSTFLILTIACVGHYAIKKAG